MENAKSKTTAGLLGILLGGFGVHNFYLGYTKKAIIQVSVNVGALILSIICWFLAFLLTFIFIGILLYPVALLLNAVSIGIGIWGLVEGVMILTGSIAVDANGNALIN